MLKWESINIYLWSKVRSRNPYFTIIVFIPCTFFSDAATLVYQSIGVWYNCETMLGSYIGFGTRSVKDGECFMGETLNES